MTSHNRSGVGGEPLVRTPAPSSQHRTLAWFSCGAASAIAAKIVAERCDDFRVVYCDTMATEHPDNQRFFDEVQEWLGVEIVRIRSDRYETVDDAMMGERYMSGVKGARCTLEMKKMPRFAYQQPGDVHVFGFTADEGKRIDEFVERADIDMWFPLAEQGITKADCYRIVEDAIELPALYRLGYRNNNCLGCVKATSARYWNMTRRDFPDVFARRVEQSRELGVRLTRASGCSSMNSRPTTCPLSRSKTSRAAPTAHRSK